MQKCCSRLRGRIDNVVDKTCKTCRNQFVAKDDDKNVRYGNAEYEVVEQLCYLGDMLSAREVAEARSISLIRSGWKNFRELVPLLTSWVNSHKTEGKLYSACVRKVKLYGSERFHCHTAWLFWHKLKESQISRINRTNTKMVKWTCHVSLRDQKSYELGSVLAI